MKILYKIFVLLSILLISCNANNKEAVNIEKPIYKLAITKAHGSSGYEQYKKWVSHHDSDIVIYDLYDLTLDSASKVLNIVDGLIISGGPDVNPNLYGEDSMAYICQTPDNYRDSLEIQSINIAYKNKIAILGICRGQQILNVAFGGSLINDIPSQIGDKVFHNCDSNICTHKINIDANGILINYSKSTNITVNSYHHQAVKELAKPFRIEAWADDSIIESVSLRTEIKYPNFFLGVQFHPEHMIDSTISILIAQDFIEALKK